MQGYWGWSEAERVSLKRDGFLTGDAGRIAENGEIELIGRVDDVLKIGGRKVNPKEVESVLGRHPQVCESAVIARADSQGILEHTLHAFVVRKAGSALQTSDLLTYCREFLEPYKVPHSISFRDALPKSSMGKILKQSLVAQVENEQSVR
jgi:long-chain acyl-CoA synthetase